MRKSFHINATGSAGRLARFAVFALLTGLAAATAIVLLAPVWLRTSSDSALTTSPLSRHSAVARLVIIPELIRRSDTGVLSATGVIYLVAQHDASLLWPETLRASMDDAVATFLQTHSNVCDVESQMVWAGIASTYSRTRLADWRVTNRAVLLLADQDQVPIQYTRVLFAAMIIAVSDCGIDLSLDLIGAIERARHRGSLDDDLWLQYVRLIGAPRATVYERPGSLEYRIALFPSLSNRPHTSVTVLAYIRGYDSEGGVVFERYLSADSGLRFWTYLDGSFDSLCIENVVQMRIDIYYSDCPIYFAFDVHDLVRSDGPANDTLLFL